MRKGGAAFVIFGALIGLATLVYGVLVATGDGGRLPFGALQPGVEQGVGIALEGIGAALALVSVGVGLAMWIAALFQKAVKAATAKELARRATPVDLYVRSMICIAAADGSVAESEKTTMANILRIGVDRGLFDKAAADKWTAAEISKLAAAQEKNVALGEALRQDLREALSRQHLTSAHIETIVNAGALIIIADLTIDAAENAMFEAICEAMGVSAERRDAQRRSMTRLVEQMFQGVVAGAVAAPASRP